MPVAGPRVVRGVRAVAALVLLNASLTMGGVWPTARVRWQTALSVEAAGLVLLLAVLRGRGSAAVRRAVACVWLLLVAGRYLDVTAPNLYGRPFNLYWDSPHLMNVAAMFAEATPAWLLLAGPVAAMLALVGAFALARWATGVLADTCAGARGRRALGATAAAVIAGFVLVPDPAQPPDEGVFTSPVIPAYVRQLRSVLATIGPGAAAPHIGPSPAALSQTPDLDEADVYLIFVESYGVVAFDSPRIAGALAESRAAFEEAARETGRQIVSALVESPTFGGSSWLAHLTLLSGIQIDDPYRYQALMTQHRDTLVTAFARAGYRTVALMPGMRQAWPEGAFYRYDRIYGRADLAYAGPQFGWWGIPDQYALARLDAAEGPPGRRRPLFVVFPTSTTHAPFGPVPPYQDDWQRVLRADGYDSDEVARILATRPRLQDLSSDYARAMAYEFLTFAGYLRQRRDEIVMILIGDHQPPAMVAGPAAPWSVPVHVVSSDVGLIDRLHAAGFRRGLAPVRPSLGPMHALTAILLDAVAARE